MSPVQEFQAVLEDAWVRWAPSWRGYALRLTRDPADADDVVQDAVTRTLRARPSLPDHRAAHGYVMQAVRTSALKLYRSRERSLRRPTRDPEVGPRPLPTALEIALYRERRAERDELIERMRRELERLPERQRQAVQRVSSSRCPQPGCAGLRRHRRRRSYSSRAAGAGTRSVAPS